MEWINQLSCIDHVKHEWKSIGFQKFLKIHFFAKFNFLKFSYTPQRNHHVTSIRSNKQRDHAQIIRHLKPSENLLLFSKICILFCFSKRDYLVVQKFAYTGCIEKLKKFAYTGVYRKKPEFGCFFNPKMFFSKMTLLELILCEESTSLKTLPWRWLREIRLCIEAKIEHVLICLY